MPGLRFTFLALAFFLPSTTALAQETAAPSPMPGLRLFAGYARLASDDGVASGHGGVLGLQGHFWPASAFTPYWGAQVLGAGVSEGFLPVLSGEFGARVMPWPSAAVRPYLRASAGLSFVLILPFPNGALSAGVALPVGGTVLDLGVTGRRAFNLLNPGNAVDEVSVQLGFGF